MEDNSIRMNSITYYNHKESCASNNHTTSSSTKRKSREKKFHTHGCCSINVKTANLPNTFWEEVVATTCYLQNRLPTTTLSSQTPFEKWSGIKPDLSHLKIFGSTTYTYVPNAIRNILEDRATKQIFI